jgi:Zn-dependent M28 family amino/carboxypeptidase
VLLTACRPEVKQAATEAEPFTPTAERAAATITAASLRQHIEALASDAFEGRGPSTQGDALTRRYLIEQLRLMGYQPAGPNGSWEQYFDLLGMTATAPPEWRFTRSGMTLGLKRREDFIATSGVQTARPVLEKAEVVFVGYGIQAPEYQWDDFKGQDLRGKVLLMLNNDPDWDPKLFAGDTRLYYGRWTYKYESAARQGAAGAIIIHTTPSAGYPYQVVQTSWSGEQFELPAESPSSLQVTAWLAESAAQSLAKLAGKDLGKLIESARSRDFQPVPLGVTTSLALDNAVRRVRTANVLGVLPGSDPKLASEVLMYTAHHDHLGIGEPDESGDKIYNGANDNAAGVAQVLAIARAFKSLPQAPRRSVLIALVGAEEQGLLGSAYYAAHPTYAPGKIAADLNYDGGNYWGRTSDLRLIGLGKSSLDEVAAVVARRQGRQIKSDPFPDRGFYYRSDQFSFAKIGVPGVHPEGGIDFIGRSADWGRNVIEEYETRRYHQPSDEIEADWNFDGMIEDAQFGFWMGTIIAAADTMPSWNAGDEFEAARKAAIEAAK